MLEPFLDDQSMILSSCLPLVEGLSDKDPSTLFEVFFCDASSLDVVNKQNLSEVSSTAGFLLQMLIYSSVIHRMVAMFCSRFRLDEVSEPSLRCLAE